MSRPITSLTGFVRKIEAVAAENRGPQLFFRGHGRKDYELVPSVFRTRNHRVSEHLMLRQLLSEHPLHFQEDQSTFEKLVRAQHYELPTRLLDVTKNPLVALYFASVSSPKSNGQVIVVKPGIQSQKYYDSDTVSCMSNLCYLTFSEKDQLLEHAINVLEDARKKHSGGSIPKSEVISEYNKHPVVEKLIQFIRMEKPAFKDKIDPIDISRVVSVVPRKLHGRLSAQDGAFLVFGTSIKLAEAEEANVVAAKIDIDHKAKGKITKELELIGISKASLFPEIDKSAEMIKRNYS